MEVVACNVRVEQFIKSLDKVNGAKAARNIGLLEQYGSQLTFPYSRKMADDLYELRMTGNNPVRIFYTYFNNQAVLLHGYIKKSARTPTRELETAIRQLKLLRQI